MTAIAGFKAAGGVVLCGDTEESDGVGKSEANKLVEYRRDWCTLGIAGSGNNSDVIDGTVEQITDTLDAQPQSTLIGIKQALRGALALLPETEDTADLLIAVCPRDNPSAELWAVSDRYLHTVTRGCHIMGMAGYVRFIADRLYRESISLHQAVLLAIHFLGISKKYVTDVDGESHILVLTNGGWLYRERIEDVVSREQFFEWFDAALGYAYLTFADTGITEREFEMALTEFSSTVRKLRADYFEKFKTDHLRVALDNPSTVEPYQTLPHGTYERYGRRKISFFWDGKSPTGVSGYYSQSVSPSGSTSPSTSASPSSDDEENESG